MLTERLLGEMDGCELARRLRELPGEKRPLLVAVAVCSGHEGRRRPAAAGFDLHLVKPVEPTVLVGLLKRFLACSSGPLVVPATVGTI